MILLGLGLPTFDDTGLLSNPPCRVVYRQSVSTLVTASHFLAGNREAELKPSTFSSLLHVGVFLSFVFSYTPPPAIYSFECCLLGLLLNNIYGTSMIEWSMKLFSFVRA